MNRISVFFAWYDLWIGAYFDRADRQLYICPIPMLGVKIDLRRYYVILYAGRVCGMTIDPVRVTGRLRGISKTEYLRRFKDGDY